MTSIAPGSIKLFGEHAVVYGYSGVSAGLGKFAYATISDCDSGICFSLPDMGKKECVPIEKIKKLHFSAKEILASGDLQKLADVRGKEFFMPFAFMIGEAFGSREIPSFALEAHSEVPRQSGLGSSSSIFVAFANEMNERFKLGFSFEQIVDLANKGDQVVHGKPSGLDVNTCARGGFLRFKKGETPTQLSIKREITVVVANSGVKKDTGIMISRVADQRKKDQKKIDAIFSEIQQAGFDGIESLEKGDLAKLGKEFDRAQECFEKLGLGTPETSEIISVSKKNNAFGAKISGAGGGGCVLILASNPEKICALLNSIGYESFVAKLGVEGVKKANLVF